MRWGSVFGSLAVVVLGLSGVPAAAQEAASTDESEPEYTLPEIIIEGDALTKSLPKPKPAQATSDAEPNPKKKSQTSAAAANQQGGGASETSGGGAGGGQGAGTGGGQGTGGTSGERIVEQVTTISEVPAKDIEQRDAKTLDKAIELVPGLYVRNGGDGVPRIDIRGLRTRNVTIFLDGVPLNSTFDGQFDPRSIPVENIARIKVTKGASSVLYGPGGNAGVIDIITKSAAPGLHGTAQIEYGGPEQGRASATTSYGGEKLKVFMSGSTFDQTYFNLSDDFDFTTNQPEKGRINSDRRDDAAYANFAYEASADTKFGVSINYRAGEYGKPLATLTQNESIFASRTRFERVDDYATLGVQATASQRFGEALTIRPSAFYNVLDELTNLYDDASFSSQIVNRSSENDAKTSIYGGGLEAAYKYDIGLLTLRGDARNEAWTADGFEVQRIRTSNANCRARGGQPVPPLGGGNNRNCDLPFDFDQDHGLDIFSVATENEIELTPQLSAVTGVGYAWQDRAEASDDDYTWLGGLKYAFDADTFVRGAVARKIRFPTLRDLYEIGRANPDLQTETTINYDLGGETTLFSPQLVVGVTLFEIDAKNFIETDSNSVAQNHDEYRFRGVETEFRFTGIDNLQLTVGHTYMKSENLSSDADTKELQFRPEHKVTLIANYQLGWGIEFNATYLYIAGSKALSRTAGSGGGGGGGGIALPDTTQVLELDDYHVVNLGLTKDFWDGQAQIYGRVENILDEDYEQSFGFPEPGRAAFVGMRIKL